MKCPSKGRHMQPSLGYLRSILRKKFSKLDGTFSHIPAEVRPAALFTCFCLKSSTRFFFLYPKETLLGGSSVHLCVCVCVHVFVYVCGMLLSSRQGELHTYSCFVSIYFPPEGIRVKSCRGADSE